MVNITPLSLLIFNLVIWVISIMLVIEIIFKGKRVRRFLIILTWQVIALSGIISLVILFWLLAGGTNGY